jgi:acetyl-CoA carboxylase carboxyl transferase subunit beta
LAIASPENLWMVPTSYFSVIAPEGAAAILLRDGGRAEEIAERLCLTPEELVRLGVARGVVPMAEPRGP